MKGKSRMMQRMCKRITRGERGRDKEQEVETTSRKVEENECNDDERRACGDETETDERSRTRRDKEK